MTKKAPNILTINTLGGYKVFITSYNFSNRLIFNTLEKSCNFLKTFSQK